MSSGFSGADVEQLDILASRFESQAARVREIIVASSALLFVTEWTGGKVDRIRSDWNSSARPSLTSLAETLQRSADTLKREADQQRQASGGGVSQGGSDRFGVREPVPSPGSDTGSTDDDFDDTAFGAEGEVGGAARTSASDRYNLTRDAGFDGVRVQGVIGADGILRYVVYLDGTDQSRGLGNRGVLENIVQLGVDTETYRSVLATLRAEVQPPDAEVMLVGYSQGGIHAQLIAASGEFEVTDVMTFGSPYTPVSDNASYHIVRIEDVSDPIPTLDLRDEASTAWRSIFGDDSGAIDQYLTRQSQTYETDASHEMWSVSDPLGSHTDPATYQEGGRQFEIMAARTDEGRAALESQARYAGTIVSDSLEPDANVYDRGSNTWLPRF